MVYRRSLRRSKRGSLEDSLFVGIVLLFFGFGILIFFYITSQINAHFDSSGILDGSPAAGQVIDDIQAMYPGIVDNSFFFLTIGLAVIVLILASMIRVHPMFMPIALFAWVFLIFISGILSNIYQSLASNTLLISSADQLTFTSLILNYLPWFTAVIGVLIMVVMYRARSDAL